MLKRKSRSLLAATLLYALGIISANASAEHLVKWPQFHGRPSHVGFNPLEETVGVNNVFNLSIQWLGLGDFSQFGLVFMSSPAIARGFAYFGDTNGNLYAFNANGCGDSACSPVWHAPLVEGIFDSPAVADGLVYVGTASPQGALFAFNAAGCGSQVCTTPVWRSTPLNIVQSSPTVANGVVYVGSEGGVYAFAAHGCGSPVCSPLWIGRTEGFVYNSPAVANGVVYAGGEDGKLYAFAAGGCGAQACRPLWTGRSAPPFLDLPRRWLTASSMLARSGTGS